MFYFFFFLMIRRPPRSTRTDHSFPTRRSSDLKTRINNRNDDCISPTCRYRYMPDAFGLFVSVRAFYPKPNQEKHTCRSEEHTSELQSLMRISYAVFCLKKKKKKNEKQHNNHTTKIRNNNRNAEKNLRQD